MAERNLKFIALPAAYHSAYFLSVVRNAFMLMESSLRGGQYHPKVFRSSACTHRGQYVDHFLCFMSLSSAFLLKRPVNGTQVDTL